MKEGSMSLPKSMNAKGSLAKGTIGLLLVCVAAAAMLLAARRPVQVDKTLMPPAKGVAASVVQPKATIATNATNSKKVKPATAPVTAAVMATPAAPEMAAEKETTAALKAPVAEATSATIAGCLDRDGDSFVMKNVEGADAPKARSWKSGFLKKGTARIEVMDASNRLKLADHVGERVSISGMLADRELQGRSLRRVASSCE
jgi:hypothetical protein